MKILFSSYAFHPGVGGIESVSAALAEEFVRAGHQVELITETPGTAEPQRAFGVTRHPGLPRLVQLLRWADVFFQNNISLRSLLPALTMQRPILIVHQTWIQNTKGEIGWNDRLKRGLLRRATNVAISRALAAEISAPCAVIPNPYRDDLFRVIPEISRDKSLVFLGRLVSDKGVDLLLQALKLMHADGIQAELTVVGTGPENEKLRALVDELGLGAEVDFAGEKSGADLAQLLNRHRFIVIPSRWAEPFGVVALEGIACGCIAVGSEQGGLKEAIGRCGVIFQNGDAGALAHSLKRLLLDPALEEELRKRAPSHLARFRAERIADEYLKLLEQIAR